MLFDIEISEHQAAIAELRQRQHQERVESLKQQLRTIRARLLPARAEHAQLTARIPIEDAARYAAQQRVLAWSEALGDHSRSRPACADYLPDDAEVREWQAQHDRLLSERDKAVAAIPPEPPHIRQAELANEIQQLEFIEANLIRTLNGSVGRAPEGGVFVPLGDRVF